MSIHAIHRDPPPWTFGDRLRKVRRSLPGRVTQEQFAEQLGYPPKRYEQWEADRNLPGSQTVEVARRIPIHPLLRDRLAELDGWAFPSPRLAGEHVSPGTIARWVSAALGEGWTAHSLRRRLATRAYRSQHDIRAVQQILGHASISTTQIYVHADEDSLTAAIRAVA